MDAYVFREWDYGEELYTLLMLQILAVECLAASRQGRSNDQ